MRGIKTQRTQTGMDRPITTLFMLSSLDGKITTGDTDLLDFDNDLPKIPGTSRGLYQYYEIEQTTDLWSLNSGRVQAKIGVNTREMPERSPVSFVIIDNKHLSEHGVRYFCALSQTFVLVTTNKEHPAFGVAADNMHIIYQEKLSLADMLSALKRDFGCERLTIQSGGTLNEQFLRQGLFDYADIVVAPLLVGGKGTSSLIDGEALHTTSELSGVRPLELLSACPLENSYLRLRYKVIND